jgi:hypothetical protein
MRRNALRGLRPTRTSRVDALQGAPYARSRRAGIPLYPHPGQQVVAPRAAEMLVAAQCRWRGSVGRGAFVTVRVFALLSSGVRAILWPRMQRWTYHRAMVDNNSNQEDNV